MLASGRHSHKGHRGKDKSLSLHTCSCTTHTISCKSAILVVESISVLLRLHREMAVDYLQKNKHMRGITLLHFKNWSSSVTH